jgi:hypothetical protein
MRKRYRTTGKTVGHDIDVDEACSCRPLMAGRDIARCPRTIPKQDGVPAKACTE